MRRGRAGVPAGETVQSERMDGKLVNVVKVTVLAYNNGAGWAPVPETVQYAIIASTDIEAWRLRSGIQRGEQRIGVRVADLDRAAVLQLTATAGPGQIR